MNIVLRRRLTIALALIVIVAVVCGVLIWRMNAIDSAESASPSDSNSESVSPAAAISEPVNVLKLVGRWLRTDSPYIIEIREVSPDGTLRAGYYNPQPINVSAAKVENKNGTLQVFVELHDAGYPGSNYTLNYKPQNDALEGTYFQATLKQNFNVAFMRMPAER
jgi:hypothetical protein